MSREEIVNALEASQTPTSIYETLHQDDGDPIYLLDQLKNSQDGDNVWLESISVKELLDKLPERDKQIISWRFFEDKTQADIARRLDLSQVQVSRLERQALRKLKELMNDSSG